MAEEDIIEMNTAVSSEPSTSPTSAPAQSQSAATSGSSVDTSQNNDVVHHQASRAQTTERAQLNGQPDSARSQTSPGQDPNSFGATADNATRVAYAALTRVWNLRYQVRQREGLVIPPAEPRRETAMATYHGQSMTDGPYHNVRAVRQGQAQPGKPLTNGDHTHGQGDDESNDGSVSSTGATGNQTI
ncbi:uncharacterized protein JN550_002063 [Neoarthrinium moseri]|uniref:uncharacterized protein n=1 Tax=Neoarthrinium moseri TaxID=1658444 RepID=UPI001FDDB85C|nr:uncharacterized protein JN550_002063 [Neoarthrinium moseri]KAI1875777.1 hypothetical protein JN550_002063 [Neoarthrinium moseri]